MIPPAPRSFLGWTVPERCLLTFVAVVAALGLIGLSRKAEETAPPVPPALVVDPNTAPPEVLGALPRLGPALVRRMVAARAERPFRSLDDLDARVSGIGPAVIEGLRPFLRVGLDGTLGDQGTP